MIVFNLSCNRHHRFEGWFASTEEFSRQAAEGLLVCPLCGDEHVERLPSAPHVVRGGERHAEPPSKSKPDQPESAILDLLQHVLRDSEDVGARFPEEARRIHYREARPRTIRGVATRQDAHELLDEGIVVLPLLVPPNGEMH